MSEVAEDAGTFPLRVGDRLRAARDAKGLSVEQVARETRVPSRHLETIESGDLSRLPAAPYSAGFIKAYARVVGLDEAELSRAFRDELAGTDVERVDMTPFEPADPSRIVPRTLAWAAALIALLIVAGYAVWRSQVGGDAETRAQLAAGTMPPSEAAPQPTVQAPMSSTPVAAQPAMGSPSGPVVLTALQPVWLRVYERDGNKTLYMGQLEQGQRYEVPASAADPLIRTGRAEFLRVTIGSAAAPPLGPPAAILSDVSLKPSALLGQEASPSPPVRRARKRPRPTESDAPSSSDPVIPALPPSGNVPLAQP